MAGRARGTCRQLAEARGAHRVCWSRGFDLPSWCLVRWHRLAKVGNCAVLLFILDVASYLGATFSLAIRIYLSENAASGLFVRNTTDWTGYGANEVVSRRGPGLQL